MVYMNSLAHIIVVHIPGLQYQWCKDKTSVDEVWEFLRLLYAPKTYLGYERVLMKCRLIIFSKGCSPEWTAATMP